jgi:hypothetical protein
MFFPFGDQGTVTDPTGCQHELPVLLFLAAWSAFSWTHFNQSTS